MIRIYRNQNLQESSLQIGAPWLMQVIFTEMENKAGELLTAFFPRSATLILPSCNFFSDVFFMKQDFVF